jgi:RNA polymerase sigma-70 factor (ECF subfamily)
MIPGDRATASARELETLFRSERRRLLSFFKRRAGDEAADLVQEVFVRAAGNARLAELDSPAAYVQRIARNLLIDRARRQKSNPALFLPFDEWQDAIASPEQAWAIEATDLWASYRQAIAAMPPKTRRVFEMSRTEEYTYRQIAERLGVTVATVEYHMMRALAACRTSIAAYYRDEACAVISSLVSASNARLPLRLNSASA